MEVYNNVYVEQDGPEWPADIPVKKGRSPFLGCYCFGMIRKVYSIWTYGYMNRIFKMGASHHRARRRKQKRKDNEDANEDAQLCQELLLSQHDLYRVPNRMTAQYLSCRFWSIYQAGNQNFGRTLWILAKPTFVPAGLCQFVTVIAQTSIPLLVWQILLVLQRFPFQSTAAEGLPFAILLFVATVVNAVFNHRHHHLAFQSGIVIKNAVADAIYEHSLQLSPQGRAGLTTGQITSLAAIDTQKLCEMMQEGHLVWSCPLAITIVSILLLIIIGPTALVGIFVLMLTLPLVKIVVTSMVRTRSKRVVVTDDRVEIVTSMLQGIKVTKLNNYEGKFEQRVEDARRREMKLVRKEQSVWAWSLAIMVITPVVAAAATFATFVLVSEDNILTGALTFTVLMLFSALRFPINYAGKLIGRAALGYQAACRMADFFKRERRVEAQDDNGAMLEVDTHNRGSILVDNASFVVAGSSNSSSTKGPPQASPQPGSTCGDAAQCSSVASISNPSFVVANIRLSVTPSEILAVVGPVGSGKTSLVNGLIGELTPADGRTASVVSAGKIAFASQLPFVLNATIKDNILFGSSYDQDLYEKVLDACCLRPDLKQLGDAGDLTEIGERGVTLSGGQKQRVCLARVVYAQPDVAIFDDPLSALDAGTGRTVFENLFDKKKSEFNLLSSTAVVLVTHASHFLHKVNKILVLNDGRSVFYGTWDELLQFESKDPSSRDIIQSMRAALKEGTDAGSDCEGRVTTWKEILRIGTDVDKIIGTSRNDRKASGTIMTVEERQHGLSNLKTWLLWFRYAGGWWFLFIQMFLLTLDRVFYVAIDYWLAFWASAAGREVSLFGISFPPQIDGRSAQYRYLEVYVVFFVLTFGFAASRSQWAVTGGARCAERMFSSMTSRVLSAPMSYFETTPMGRIMNRFTHDVEVLDVTLTQAMTILIIATGWFVAAICVMIGILRWVIAAIVPVLIGYTLVLMHYRKSSADLQRLDVIARSPVQALLSEGLDGAAIIRVFKKSDYFITVFQSALDKNSAAMLNFISAHRWLAVRIETFGALITLAATVLVTVLNGRLRLQPGIVGLLIMWSSNFTLTLGFLVDSISETEAAITSIERMYQMNDLPQERREAAPLDKIEVDESWPRKGELLFDNVKLRYRKGLDLSLDGLSFKLEHGDRVGVVGRTGAGKSTLTSALFRLVEIESGCIKLDSVDLAKINLCDVRGRPQGMAIIPQDPVLFTGSLRECLDPFGVSTDEMILEALKAVQISSAAIRGVSALDDIVEEGGANYSVGERQLLCLARALLAKPKLLVMDEATASVDGKTDAFIQDMVRKRFRDTTLLTIAHRLNTIMDYDKILVMNKGKAVEFGHAKNLLDISDGVFTELVDATGEESAAALKLMADHHYQQYKSSVC